MDLSTSRGAKPEKGESLAALKKAALKLFLTLLTAGAVLFALNCMMEAFLESEVAQIKRIADRAAKAEAALRESEDEAEKAKLRYQADLLKAEQAETFYQKYKDRWAYQDYGQYYELYERTVSADVVIIGTSHATHGINPFYLEKANLGYKFFNFALNGSNPQYYYDWYTKLFSEADYPAPKLIIFGVDWFMFDDGWLWRRLEYDDSPDRPVDIMRKLVAAEGKKAPAAGSAETAENSAPAETAEAAGANGSAKTGTKGEGFIDRALREVFSRVAIIYARDRFFEMLGGYFTGRVFTSGESETAETASDTSSEAETGETAEYTLPVYKHEYLIDGSGFVTSGFYKGFIPWENKYNGGKSDAGCSDNPSQVKIFAKLLDLFEAARIPVVFVMCPEYLEGRNAPQFEEKNAYLASAAESRGIPYLCYNDKLVSEINGDYTMFSDWGHLNAKGAAAFSKLLAEDIAPYLP